MTYCPNCGAPAEGRFCAKCGASLVGAGESAYEGTGASTGATSPPPGSASSQPLGANSLGMEENIASALCYIPIVGLIFLFVAPYNRNKTVRFHALQSIFYCVAWMVVMIGLSILTAMFSLIHLWVLWGFIATLVELAFFAGLILMAFKAYQRERFVMPIVGPMAQRQA